VYVSNIAAQRMAEAAARVNARISEISMQTGISFPSIFGERLDAAAAQQASAAAPSSFPPPPIASAIDLIMPQAGSASNPLHGFNPAFDPMLPGVAPNTSTLDGLFSSVAESYGLNPALLQAIAGSRSGLDSGFVSPSGALGLMQLFPSTAEGLGVRNPFDPYDNLDGGARNLVAQIIRYNGDVLMALAASEVGPAELRRLGVNDPSQFHLLPLDVQERIAEVRRVLDAQGLSHLIDRNFFE
jgi:soluble lytic murein transglycosylase-like protein